MGTNTNICFCQPVQKMKIIITILAIVTGCFKNVIIRNCKVQRILKTFSKHVHEKLGKLLSF